MLRLLADENFNGDVVRGLLRSQPDLELIRVQDTNLMGASDPDVLAWAAENGPILLTHDRATMPDYAFERIADGNAMPGVFVLSARFPAGLAIAELLLVIACSEQVEWNGLVTHLPL